MPEQDRPGQLSRRALIQAGLLGVGAATLWPVSAPVAKPRDVPRNRTLTLVWTGREGRWVDHELWNPYAIGANHQSGPGIFYEPLAYYSAFADKAWCRNNVQFYSACILASVPEHFPSSITPLPATCGCLRSYHGLCLSEDVQPRN